MILGDFGADVVLIERPGGTRAGIQVDGPPILSRGKRSIILDLSVPDDVEVATRIAEHADVLVEGFRPGVMERLGLGPEVLCELNPRLIYTRVSGWGQSGPYAHNVGHDINYIALAGPLGQIGAEAPVPPGAFVGDLAGGSLTAVIGVLLALQARHKTGRGQVVDAAIMDGAAQLMAPMLELHACGVIGPRGTNVVDGMAPYYGCYRCADGGWYSVGAVEAKFYANLLRVLGLDDEDVADQNRQERWPVLRARIAEIFLTRTRDEWSKALEDEEICGAPVLDIEELPLHPHLKERGLFARTARGIEGRPSPLLSDTPGWPGPALEESGQHSAEIRAQLFLAGGEFPARP
ncbi:alpha-methylacyl-CoA racemase [Mycobacterium saskatchewanense]|uniref:CoA transferase n=2 Tax=Mycobacterium saskatchewanense TaxID=220927 RepID=A0AAJ3TXF3_9MYCO|nr:hypothetical protein AWC23_08750 [Mycobacterium saskatchewanense]BBX62537.1 alpha-methylacyl-CoA racemase [Mycobacterium saskatchewanense]